MKILQINELNINSVDSIISDKNIEIFNKKELLANDDADIVLIGIGDNGYEFDIDKLIELRNNGKTIIFTHSNPISFLDKMEDEKEIEFEKRNNIYLAKLKDNFGINGFADSYDYEFYDTITVKDNTIISTGEYSIQPTHTTGIVLSDKYKIIADSNQCKPGMTNYYLAILSEANKGDVVMWNVGHCAYGKNDIKEFSKIEKNILDNLLQK